MKIQVISNLFPLPWEPNRAAFNRQQFELLAKTCKVKVLVVVPWLIYFKNRGSVSSRQYNNINIDYLCYFYIPKVARALYPICLFLTLVLKIRQIIKFKPDCLLLSWVYPDAVAGVLLSKILKIPAVIKVHGSDINMHGLSRSRSFQIVWAMKHAKAVLSVSKDLANKMVELGVPKEKITVIYNGVNKTIFYPQRKPGLIFNLQLDEARKRLLYVGNLKREKGCLDLFEAFKSLAEADDSIDLYYIGEGSLSAEISNKAQDSNLQKRVTLLGTLKHQEIAMWINVSTLTVLPSYNEGVPNVLLESMACGTPVVATRVGGIPEIISKETGILSDKGDISSLINALKSALSKQWEPENIVDSVNELTWENNIHFLKEQLDKAVAGN